MNYWVRFEDQLPDDKSMVMISDGMCRMRYLRFIRLNKEVCEEYEKLGQLRYSYFFQLLNGAPVEEDINRDYPIWCYPVTHNFQIYFDKENNLMVANFKRYAWVNENVNQ